MTDARHRHLPRKNRRIPSLIAIVLATIGALLITLAACSSKSGPPQPLPSQAGTLGGDVSSSAPGVAGTSPAAASSAAPGSASSAGASTGTAPTGSPAKPTTATSPKATTGKQSSSGTVSAVGPSTPSPTSKIVVPTFSNPAKGLVLQSSAPVSMSIPSLGVTSALLDLGLNPDGTVQVPSLDDPESKAGWYKNSPTPGAVGPAIILGHIDSKKYGPGVFYKLGDLQPGQEIDVTRADGSVAVFKVDGVRSYPKNNFPTKDVYGNIDHAGLRLITCGGTFDFDKHSYEDNIVAYASLVSSH
ncbi:hypothetical protein ABIB25_002693 [Nakamurella sp. UYEF19]|uniref:class F sortase n=1 Tax=Nakamurella sp. UYEF19 TaxID=1756392 RepID=UPI00339254B3